MQTKALAFAALAGLATIAVTGSANAAAVSGIQGAIAADHSLVQNTDYLFEGRQYCWYPGGWHGPGYYWCGYAYRRGYGWGGGYGWNGWGRGGPGYSRGFYGGGYGGGYRGGAGFAGRHGR